MSRSAASSNRLARAPKRHKLLALLFAYVCIGAVFVSTLLSPPNQPQPDEVPDAAHLADPCQAEGSLLSSRHLSQADFRKKHLLDEEYRQAVWQALAPQPRDIERLVLSKNWSPHAPRDASVGAAVGASRLDVVLALQCSPDRLPFLSAVTEQWNGPFALAIYVPAPAQSKRGQACRARILEHLHQHTLHRVPAYAVSLLYANGEVPNLHCQLSRDFTGFEPPAVNRDAFRARFGGRPWTSLAQAEYPVNELRTLARSMVREDSFIFLAESDFMVPHNLHGKLTSGQHLRTLETMRDAWRTQQERHAMILPAFERLATVPATAEDAKRCAARSSAVWWGSTCFMYGDYDVPSSKASLRAMVDDGRAVVFYETQFLAGHGCYFPRDWLNATQPYEVEYTNPCEPYFIALAAALPPFEPRFKGRIRDKVSILSHMAAWGFTFTVDPELFVVHLPHAPAVTLTNMSSDASVHANMWTAPFALTHVLLENAALEPQFARVVTQAVPNVGIVTAQRPAGRAAADGGAAGRATAGAAGRADVQTAAGSMPWHSQLRAHMWVDCKVDYGALVWHSCLLLAALVAATAVVMRT